MFDPKEYYFKNRARIIAYRRKRRIENHAAIVEKERNYKEKNKERLFKSYTCWYAQNKERVSEVGKKYRLRKLYDIRERDKERGIRDKEKRRIRHRAYYLNNREKLIAKACAYAKIKAKTDHLYRLSRNLRTRLRSAIRGNFKAGSAVRDLGCSIPELKQYLESKFQPGMSWDNWGRGPGKWNIDHIIPLSFFDLQNETEFKMAVRYQNLQPMWAVDNFKKHSTIPNCVGGSSCSSL